MTAAIATVLGHAQVERKRATVHLLLQTDLGAIRLRFTEADAHVIGGQLRVASVRPTGERACDLSDPSAPILKPGGSLL